MPFFLGGKSRIRRFWAARVFSGGKYMQWGLIYSLADVERERERQRARTNIQRCTQEDHERRRNSILIKVERVRARERR